VRFDLGPSLAAAKVAAIARVDAEAEQARLRLITPGAGQALEYQATEAEALRLLGDPSPDPTSYPFLVAEASAQGLTTEADLALVADQVLAAAAAWRSGGAEIKRLRRSAKLAIAVAASPTEVREAANVIWPSAGNRSESSCRM